MVLYIFSPNCANLCENIIDYNRINIAGESGILEPGVLGPGILGPGDPVLESVIGVKEFLIPLYS